MWYERSQRSQSNRSPPPPQAWQKSSFVSSGLAARWNLHSRAVGGIEEAGTCALAACALAVRSGYAARRRESLGVPAAQASAAAAVFEPPVRVAHALSAL